MSAETNITDKCRLAFNALCEGREGFALFSCFVNGEPASAIVAVIQTDTSIEVLPLFVSVTPSMELVDHDGTAASLDPELPH